VREAVASLRGRGVHAVLLHGPTGVGKLETALLIARDELCERPRDRAGDRSCGTCASCLLFAAGSHPDLRVVVPDTMAARRPGPPGEEDEESAAVEEDAGTGAGPKKRISRVIRIEQVRALLDFIHLTTHRAGTRVVVLGPAETLNGPSGNALLKNLEEPPPGSLYLLTSDQFDRCLPTIVSRCACLRVPVPEPGRALSWLHDQGIADAGVRLTESGGAPFAVLRSEGEAALSGADREALLSMLRKGTRLEPAEVATRVSRTIPVGAAVALLQRWGWDYFAHQLAGRLRYHSEDAAPFEAIAVDGWPLAAAAAWLDRLRELRAVADHPLNARAAVEGALLDYIASLQGRRAG
jgi:DNA polymerase-3 subunit delta'